MESGDSLAIKSFKLKHYHPDEIRWRQHLGKRPWLAGTVLNKTYSLLNMDELIKPFHI